ncbi:MAG: HpcH/HpaI aldolase/citrate lyase family protein [Beijerinckiaceae bacterium]
MRSLLFVPGDDEKKLAKGLGSGADALLIDLEDSVSGSRKDAAREITRSFIQANRQAAARPRLYVRVNAHDTGLTSADLDAVMQSGPEGIMLPKCQSGDDVALLSARVAVREAENSLPDGSTAIIAIATETARSVFHMGSYVGISQRLTGLTWGGEDLSADVGAEANRLTDGGYTDPYRLARSLCLFAASAAQAQPIDSVYTNFRDMDGLKLECEAARRDGFTGKMAIHPAQVPVINAVFTPSPKAVERAKQIIALFAANPEAGVIGLDGEMLDRPHIRRAERVLAAARAAGIA